MTWWTTLQTSPWSISKGISPSGEVVKCHSGFMIFHFCSESSNADTAEENSANEDIYSTVKKKCPLKMKKNKKRTENGDIYSTMQKRTHPSIKSSIIRSSDEKVFSSVKDKGCNDKKNGSPEDDEEPIYATLRQMDSYPDEDDALAAQIEECEDLAMEALDTAVVAVTGDSTVMHICNQK